MTIHDKIEFTYTIAYTDRSYYRCEQTIKTFFGFIYKQIYVFTEITEDEYFDSFMLKEPLY